MITARQSRAARAARLDTGDVADRAHGSLDRVEAPRI